MQDQTRRDIVSKEDFGALLSEYRIANDSTVVLYGDSSNWFVAYTYWVFKYYGHDDLRLLNDPGPGLASRREPVHSNSPSPIVMKKIASRPSGNTNSRLTTLEIRLKNQ